MSKENKDEEMRMSDEALKNKREREDDDGYNCNASKAIRGERREGVKRSGDALPDISIRKLVRTEGESRGDITREVITKRPAFNPQGVPVDSIDSVEWEESKQEIRELKVLVIMIDGGSRRRGIQACEIQHMKGGYYVWETENSGRLDVMTSERMRR